jgi:hypothetical protein
MATGDVSADQPEEIRIEWQDLGKPVDRASGKAYKIVVKREPIPIVVLPGIMGTRLRQGAGKREKIWDPDDLKFMFQTYGLVSVSALDKQNDLFGRSRQYQPGYLVPYEDDQKHNKACFGETVGFGKPVFARGGPAYPEYRPRYPDAAKRGWGGVSWDAYSRVILGLQNQVWPDLIATCFSLPVYAVGYDWRGSAELAGRMLKDRIASIKKDNPGCQKVILVTHSMGGLVARSACAGGLESEVLGVLHTVQPVTGAPAAYWRMKAGFERIGRGVTGHAAAWVLGANGLEVTALLGHMPGGLQLLPSMSYGDNQGHAGWLVFRPAGGGDPVRLPRTGDPYGEIYRNQDQPWRLVLWRDYLAGERQASAADRDRAWVDFIKRLAEAETFHRDLGLYQHAKSWHFYGQGRETADSVTLSESTIDVTPYIDPLNGVFYDPTPSLDERGRFSYAGPARADGDRMLSSFYEMSQPAGDGDSTVPRSSGSILTVGGAPGIPLPGSGHDTCFKDNDLVASSGLASNLTKVIQGLCFAKIDAEKRW